MLMCILSVYITYLSLFWIFAVYWLFSLKHSIHDYNGNSCWVKIGNTSRCCKKKMETNQVNSAFSYLVLTSLIISHPGKYSFTYMSTHHPPHTRLDEWFSDLSMSRVPGRALDDSQDFLSDCHWHHTSRLISELIGLGCIWELKSREQYLFPSHLSSVTFRYKFRRKCCCC